MFKRTIVAVAAVLSAFCAVSSAVCAWGKTGTRGEICRNFNSHFFPCFYWEFKGKKEFLDISTNFSSCTVFTLTKGKGTQSPHQQFTPDARTAGTATPEPTTGKKKKGKRQAAA